MQDIRILQGFPCPYLNCSPKMPNYVGMNNCKQHLILLNKDCIQHLFLEGLIGPYISYLHRCFILDHWCSSWTTGDMITYVIYYISKNLTLVESNYTVTENEFLVVVYATNKLRHYITGYRIFFAYRSFYN